MSDIVKCVEDVIENFIEKNGHAPLAPDEVKQVVAEARALNAIDIGKAESKFDNPTQEWKEA